MKYLIIILMILSLSACASHNPRPWTKKEKQKEIVYQVLSAVDFYRTEQKLDQEGFYELNPAIGKHPSDTDLGLWAVGSGVAHYFLTDYFVNYDSEKSVNLWQNVSIGYKSGAILWSFKY